MWDYGYSFGSIAVYVGTNTSGYIKDGKTRKILNHMVKRRPFPTVNYLNNIGLYRDKNYFWPLRQNKMTDKISHLNHGIQKHKVSAKSLNKGSQEAKKFHARWEQRNIN